MDILKKIPLMTTLHGAMTTDPAEDSVADGFMSSLHDSWVEMWASTLHIYAGTLVVVGTGTVLGTSIEAGNVSQLIDCGCHCHCCYLLIATNSSSAVLVCQELCAIFSDTIPCTIRTAPYHFARCTTRTAPYHSARCNL